MAGGVAEKVTSCERRSEIVLPLLVMSTYIGIKYLISVELSRGMGHCASIPHHLRFLLHFLQAWTSFDEQIVFSG